MELHFIIHISSVIQCDGWDIQYMVVIISVVNMPLLRSREEEECDKASWLQCFQLLFHRDNSPVSYSLFALFETNTVKVVFVITNVNQAPPPTSPRLPHPSNITPPPPSLRCSNQMMINRTTEVHIPLLTASLWMSLSLLTWSVPGFSWMGACCSDNTPLTLLLVGYTDLHCKKKMWLNLHGWK